MHTFLSCILTPSLALAQTAPAANAPAPGPARVVASATVPVDVLEDTVKIEEPGLVQDSSKAGLLPVMGTKQKIQDSDMETPVASRIYRLVLKPNTRLKIQLKVAGESEIIMRFIRTTQGDPLSFQVKQANMPPVPTRRQYIKIENPTAVPQACLLFLSGKQGYPYTMALEWTQGK